MPQTEPLRLELPPLTGPQMDICHIDERPERCWDVEGAPRSAKSWGIGFWIWKLAYQYPGIQIFYCRYKDEGLIQLRDIWNKITIHFPEYLHARWNAQDQAYDFPNGKWIGDVYTGSRVFLSSLKVSEASGSAAIHGKYKGKTIAVVIIEEAQEVPRDNYIGLKERLSQSKTPDGQSFRYPLKIVLVHNAVSEDHWIAKDEFPLDANEVCDRPDHAHIRADVYSNAQNLGPQTMLGYEFDYPPSHPLRKTQIEGRRGVTLFGRAVYTDSFQRMLHVGPVGLDPHYPLIEGWDFGVEKPAVVWMQHITHLQAIRVLGGVKGSELFLETFAPKVLEIRRRAFPTAREVRIWCDPTGATGNGGLAYTPVRLLHQLGIPARPCRASEGAKDGNDPVVRDQAIQVIGSYMLRLGLDQKPAFRVAPVCLQLKRKSSELLEEQSSKLVEAFAAGYIWDEKLPSDAAPNIRKPKKGTPYDDLMNALEYCVIGEGVPIAVSPQVLGQAVAQYQTAEQRMATMAAIEQARQLKIAQRDSDPYDRGARVRSRRGVL